MAEHGDCQDSLTGVRGTSGTHSSERLLCYLLRYLSYLPAPRTGDVNKRLLTETTVILEMRYLLPLSLRPNAYIHRKPFALWGSMDNTD